MKWRNSLGEAGEVVRGSKKGTCKIVYLQWINRTEVAEIKESTELQWNLGREKECTL